MKEIVRLGFIGTGNVAHLHAQALQRVENALLVGAWSRSPAKTDAFAAQYRVKSYPELDALLEDGSIDAVSVLVHSNALTDYALRCLKAGKHVLLEKPVARSIADISNLKTAAAAAGRLCMPSHNYIYAPELREAKRRLDAGDFGRLSSFWMIYNQKHPANIGFADLITREVMVHHAYAAIYFGGRPRRVTASASNVYFTDGVSPDQVMAVAENENGTISNLWASFGVDDFTSNPWNVFYKVLGTEGGFQKNWNDTQFGKAELPGWDKAAYRDSFYFVQDFFVNQCLRRDMPPLSNLDDAAAALRLFEAIETSLASSKKVDVKYA